MDPVGAKLNYPRGLWVESASEIDRGKHLAAALGKADLIGNILAARGIVSEVDAREFFESPLTKLCDPFMLSGMETAVERLQTAIRKGERILIYGDYDVDGIMSVVVLKTALELLGACVEYHIPHRIRDGYGMRSEVVERAAQSGTGLVVSVDTGIRSNTVVAAARTRNLDVIVTDHHLPDEDLPPALAVINPNQPGCAYPNKYLCGAGVALKLAQAVLQRSSMQLERQTALLHSFLKPVAIATVADVVPLTGENRIIVRRGLAGLKQVTNSGLRALLDVAGLDPGEIPSAHQVGFRLAPRINAAGRMASADEAVELFLTRDDGRAREIAARLDVLNRARQEEEQATVAAILAECEADEARLRSSGLVFAGENWHPGVLGIVASRLAERLSRPVIVLGPAEADFPCMTGSGRSIPSFHLLEALESMSGLFIRHGGHRGAAGLTIRTERLEEFRERFNAYAAAVLTEEQQRPCFSVDARVSFSELDGALIKQLLDLGPFGHGNPPPMLLASGVELAGTPRMLGNEKHWSLPIRQGHCLQVVKAWNFPMGFESCKPGDKLDILFQVDSDSESKKRGYPPWHLALKDLRSSENQAT